MSIKIIQMNKNIFLLLIQFSVMGRLELMPSVTRWQAGPHPMHQCLNIQYRPYWNISATSFLSQIILDKTFVIKTSFLKLYVKKKKTVDKHQKDVVLIAKLLFQTPNYSSMLPSFNIETELYIHRSISTVHTDGKQRLSNQVILPLISTLIMTKIIWSRSLYSSVIRLLLSLFIIKLPEQI